MVGCKPIFVPLNQNGKLNADASEVLEDATMYRKIVGSLIYMTITRPDLNYTIGLEIQLTFGWCEAHTTLCECHSRLWFLL
jgi:hypothetical protein